MNLDSLIRAIQAVRPGASWAIRGETYEGLEWMDAVQSKPTKEELESAADATAYRDQRRPEYPSIADQLDAMWKGGDAAAEMLARIQSVKEKYPKP